MKKLSSDFPFSSDPPVFRLKSLTVRALSPDEFERANRLFDKEHSLGNLSKGRGLLQVVEDSGRCVALLDWGQAAWRLIDRDEHIGTLPRALALDGKWVRDYSGQHPPARLQRQLHPCRTQSLPHRHQVTTLSTIIMARNQRTLPQNPNRCHTQARP